MLIDRIDAASTAAFAAGWASIAPRLAGASRRANWQLSASSFWPCRHQQGDGDLLFEALLPAARRRQRWTSTDHATAR